MNNYNIDFYGYFATFGIMNLIMLIAGFFGSKMTSNRKRLQRKEYPESYIAYSQNFSKKFGLRFGLVILLLEVIFSVIVLLITRRLGSDEFVTYIMIPSVMLSIPFATYYATKANGDYKKMAKEEGRDIVVDFNHNLLKEIFSMPLEIAATLFVLSFSLVYVPWKNAMVLYLYIMLPWFFAASLFFSKNYILPVLKDSYSMIGRMTVIYQGLLIVLLLLESIEPVSTKGSIVPWISLIALSVFLLVKILYYLPGLKRLETKLKQL